MPCEPDDPIFWRALLGNALADPRSPAGGGGPGKFMSPQPLGSQADLWLSDLGLHPLAPANRGCSIFGDIRDFPSALSGSTASTAKRAPWMEYAIAEAKRHKGATEDEIEKTINYHKQTGSAFLGGMSGTEKAWCASFVNWCLQSAGIPKWKNSFRARAVADDNGFSEIKFPVYGAIVLVGTHHACFFYAYDKKTAKPICLGGNQSDQINFTMFTESVRYFVPSSYFETAMQEIKNIPQHSSTAAELNAELGIVTSSRNHGSTR